MPPAWRCEEFYLRKQRKQEDEPEKDWPVDMLEQQFGSKRDRDIFYTAGCASKAALPPDSMPTLYNLWDALLYLTGGEPHESLRSATPTAGIAGRPLRPPALTRIWAMQLH